MNKIQYQNSQTNPISYPIIFINIRVFDLKIDQILQNLGVVI